MHFSNKVEMKLSLRGLPGAVSEGHIDGDDVTLGQEGVQAVLPLHAHLVKAVRLLMAVVVQPLDIPWLRNSPDDSIKPPAFRNDEGHLLEKAPEGLICPR